MIQEILYSNAIFFGKTIFSEHLGKENMVFRAVTTYWNAVMTFQEDVATTSQLSLKLNAQRRFSGTSQRPLSCTYPRRHLSTSLWHLL